MRGAASPVRQVRRASRGQSLLIFGLSAFVLFGICGLAVDAGLSYLSANRVERAAAAGALAGVTYMPAQVPTATLAARAAVQRNGFVDDTGTANTTHVYVYRVPAGCDASGSTTPCSPNRLGVGVAQLVNNTFTKILGFGPTHWVRQDATAEYLPTLTLGQPGAKQGSTLDDLTTNSCCYIIRTEGWATDRGQGDAYTPNPADPGNTGLATRTDVHGLSGTLQTDLTTMSGFQTLPTQGGYNFQIAVPAGTSNANMMVYNPAFAPNSSNDYHEADSITANNHAQYSVMEYTLFQVTDPFNHLKDIPLAQMMVNPIDASNSDQTTWVDGINNSSGGGTLSSTSIRSIYHNWVDIFHPSDYGVDSKGTSLIKLVGGNTITQLTGGNTYRMRIDTLDDVGGNPGPGSTTRSAAHKGQAVEVALNSTPTTTCDVCTLGALNDFAVYTPLSSPRGTTATFDIPLVNIPKQYAGLTVNFYVYDPGDLSQSSNLLSIINPDTGNPATPAARQDHIPIYNLGPSRDTTPSSSNEIVPNDPQGQRPNSPDVKNATIQTIWSCAKPHDCYDGNWLLYKVTVPTDYTGTTTNGAFWKIRYVVNGGGTANDTFTMVVGFDGPPVHLIPNP